MDADGFLEEMDAVSSLFEEFGEAVAFLAEFT
jgi:hypothetical protein